MAFAKGLYHTGRLWSMCTAGKRHMAAAVGGLGGSSKMGWLVHCGQDVVGKEHGHVLGDCGMCD